MVVDTLYRIEGVDPGLVHTGVFEFEIRPSARAIGIAYDLCVGLDLVPVLDAGTRALTRLAAAPAGPWRLRPDDDVRQRTFIEAYKPRSVWDTDKRMGEGVAHLKKTLPHSTLVPNSGIKKVITAQVLSAFAINGRMFAVSANHQDLLSAARIALLGMAKDPELNGIMFDVIDSYRAGHEPWSIDVRHP